MQSKTRIEDLSESNVEDLICVCSSKRLDDPIHQQGMKLKRQWLNEMLSRYGPIAKIGYYEEKPAAQILYYPEEADVTRPSGRKDVLVISCIYNPTSAAQKQGLGKQLLQSVIQDAKSRKTCLGNRPCRFILTRAFNTGEFLPLPQFFRKNGFLPAGESDLLYFPVEGGYEPTAPVGEYVPLSEDRGKATILYGPTYQFSYQFTKRVEELIREVALGIPVEMINEWERPEESKKRKNQWLVVNAKPVRTFFMDTAKFKEEVRQAMC